MKRFAKLAVLIVLISTLSLGLIANGLNLNSNGAKAISMGGAFVGLADDFSAVHWNPAGLVQMKETTLSFYLSDVIPNGTYQFDLLGIDTSMKSRHYLSGSMGFFKPISDKIVVGIYAYVPSGIGGEWDGNDLKLLSGGVAYDWESFFGLATIAPTIAVKLSDKFSLGGSLNINYSMLNAHRPALGQYYEKLDGMAVGATIGMLFKPVEQFSIGFTFRTPLSAKISGTAKMSGAPLLGLPAESEAEREATFPMWIAGGICFKPTDKLTITADAQYTNWKELTRIPITFDNAGWEMFFADGSAFELKWKDAVQLRFGMEYKVSQSLALRAGFYTDPVVSPIETHNILLPELGYNWITFGFGYTSGNVSIDFAVEYGMGDEIEVGLTEADPSAGMPGVHGMNILVPAISVSIRL